ncbi:MAG: hypothetical protein PHO67_08210 [Candidatus Omnitrophica bacterium]|nr:hypothetical protein [Candidatus Omnitrophota bacterium]
MGVKRWNASNAMEDCADSNRTATFISGCEKYVLASDYDSLLSVLRRCVTWMDEQFCPEDIDCKNCHEGREIVAAARAVMEEENHEA